jgi:hypothetical protein
LIHRDHRKWWESASSFGQLVARLGPHEYTGGDVDWVGERRLRDGRLLLRLIEHKQLDMLRDKRPQLLLQHHLAMVLDHARSCPAFTVIRLHPDSGFYQVVGPLQGIVNGRREVVFAGTQTITPMVMPVENIVVETMSELNSWLVGGERWTPRRPGWRAA